MTRPLPSEVVMLRWNEPRGDRGEYVQRRRFYTDRVIAERRHDLLKADPQMTAVEIKRTPASWGDL